MDFDTARKQFERLSRLFQKGEISSEEFTKGVDKLSITDQSGDEWMIGMRSGNWYRKEGEDWVEDDPVKNLAEEEEEVKAKKARRRTLILLIAILILVLFCFGTWNLGLSGLIPEGFRLGQTGGSGTQETAPVSQATSAILTLDISAETAESSEPTLETPEITLTPTLTDSQGGEPVQTSTATIQPTATLTPTPPAPIAAPENWELRSALNMDDTSPLKQDWAKIPDKPWEFEFISYEDREALLIQFTETDVLWHADGAEVDDVERTITMAIPDIEGAVSMICWWQSEDNSGYKIRLSNTDWQLIEVTEGNETILEEGSQSPSFDIGNYADFVYRCVDERIELFRDGEQLLDFGDAAYATGAAGLQFEIDEGIGLAFITSDQVWARLAENIPAEEGVLIRRADLDIWLVAVRDNYDAMVENGYEGQALISFELRVANSGSGSVQITPQNLILSGVNRDVRALDFVPQTAEGSQLFPYGEVTGEVSGEVFFAGVSPAGLQNWSLVVDLRYQGYGEAIFELGGE